MTKTTTTTTKTQLILCIDLGSSSVRCSLYELVVPPHDDDGTAAETGWIVAWHQGHDGSSFLSSSSRPWQAVHAGKIQWWQKTTSTGKNDDGVSLLDLVEECIDDILVNLQQTCDKIQIVAVGFSSLVMNLVGVDKHGKVIPEATLSYSCNETSVATRVKTLQR